MRILVVEDDQCQRQLLSLVLRDIVGVMVEEAGDGREALERVQGHRPDLLITDCHMPGMDGLTLARQLRMRGEQTPIIMLSGESDPQAPAAALAAGVNRYLPKPLNVDLLLATIRDACAGLEAAA